MGGNKEKKCVSWPGNPIRCFSVCFVVLSASWNFHIFFIFSFLSFCFYFLRELFRKIEKYSPKLGSNVIRFIPHHRRLDKLPTDQHRRRLFTTFRNMKHSKSSFFFVFRWKSHRRRRHHRRRRRHHRRRHHRHRRRRRRRDSNKKIKNVFLLFDRLTFPKFKYDQRRWDINRNFNALMRNRIINEVLIHIRWVSYVHFYIFSGEFSVLNLALGGGWMFHHIRTVMAFKRGPSFGVPARHRPLCYTLLTLRFRFDINATAQKKPLRHCLSLATTVLNEFNSGVNWIDECNLITSGTD